jgi:hypothetical protein
VVKNFRVHFYIFILCVCNFVIYRPVQRGNNSDTFKIYVIRQYNSILKKYTPLYTPLHLITRDVAVLQTMGLINMCFLNAWWYRLFYIEEHNKLLMNAKGNDIFAWTVLKSASNSSFLDIHGELLPKKLGSYSTFCTLWSHNRTKRLLKKHYHLKIRIKLCSKVVGTSDEIIALL